MMIVVKLMISCVFDTSLFCHVSYLIAGQCTGVCGDTTLPGVGSVTTVVVLTPALMMMTMTIMTIRTVRMLLMLQLLVMTTRTTTTMMMMVLPQQD